jgi:hypothetical protein
VPVVGSATQNSGTAVDVSNRRLEPARYATDEPDVLEGSDVSPATLAPERDRQERPQGMLPGRDRRRTIVERGFFRIVATGGIIGIATILGAVLVSQDVAGWIVGLAVGLTSLILAALLWSSRQL